jgi:hypothetical protein
MAHRDVELRLQELAIVRHLAVGLVVAERGERGVRSRMASDRNERMVRQRAQAVGCQEVARGELFDRDAVGCERWLERRLATKVTADPAGDRTQARNLRVQIRAPDPSIHGLDLDGVVLLEQGTQPQPPRVEFAGGRLGRHEDGKWDPGARHGRQRVLQRVAIAVIERDRGERLRRSVDDAPHRLVQSDDVTTRGSQSDDQGFEKCRRATGAEIGGDVFLNFVKHQDDASIEELETQGMGQRTVATNGR